MHKQRPMSMCVLVAWTMKRNWTIERFCNRKKNGIEPGKAWQALEWDRNNNNKTCVRFDKTTHRHINRLWCGSHIFIYTYICTLEKDRKGKHSATGCCRVMLCYDALVIICASGKSNKVRHGTFQSSVLWLTRHKAVGCQCSLLINSNRTILRLLLRVFPFFLVCLPKCCLLFCNGAFQNRVQLFYSSSLIFTFEFCLCWKKTLYSELCFNYLFIFQIEFLFSNTSLKNKESDK